MNDEMKEIYETFAAECADHVRKATDYILQIEESKDEEALNGLFRTFHTIKGNARMLEFNHIGELAHSAENVMARLRNGTLAPSKQVVDLLLAALDSISILVSEGVAGEEDSIATEALMASLDAVAAGTESPQNARIKAKAETAPPVSPKRDREQAPSAPTVRRDERGPLNILVVEDDFLSRKTLVAMLKPYGTCDVAVDGNEAIEAFARALEDHPYDLVCMDIMMPRTDGFEAAKQIRTAEMIAAVRKMKEAGIKTDYYERKDAVVIMTSSLDDPENYVNACYRCGANAYLVKPILPDTLRAALERFALA